jgi:RNA polymerase sigma-70 factor (ECF subfamily)
MRETGLSLEDASDDALLAGLMTDDPELAVAFVRRFQHKVFGVAIAVTRDVQLAEDVAQRTFERAWRHAQVYDWRRGSVRTWLTSIARNLAIDAVRARKALPVDPSDLAPLLEAVTQSPERQAIADETSQEVRSAVADLPPAQARAVAMAGMYGMTAQQIADAERVPVGTAKTRIRTALGKLRVSLSDTQDARYAGHTEYADHPGRPDHPKRPDRPGRADHAGPPRKR